MSAIATTRLVRPTTALRPMMMLGQRSFRVSAQLRQNSETPMSQKNQNQSFVIGGVGLALGLGFFYLMTRPEKAKDQPIEGVKTKIASAK
ncbi:hypothetical protein BHE90_015469 [Fusarium euwallaceae]|uniref:Uncharacterized protein n=1 Tax=Fusarium euwallaceae TaxID=1147111 RepID=A0A430L339_9HYPO|nr:hypothetical protein BHE90_015469 [Fusarium euwallaceae]